MNTSSTVIHLEEKEPPASLWPTTSVKSLHKNFPSPWFFFTEDKNIELMCTSIKEDFVCISHRSLLQCFVDAFCQHRPITISPDIFWILILQGFTHHVTVNHEKLKSKFVKFNQDKEPLKIQRKMFPEEATEEVWNGIFQEFIDKISDYTGLELIEKLTPDFSTTTPVSKAAGQVTIMAAMKNYFTYQCDFCGCGLPSITVEGSVDDWRKIYEKVEYIEQDETRIDGWICAFFPYDGSGERLPLDSLSMFDSLPSEIVSVPFDLVFYLPWEDPETIPPIKCEIRSGFIGVKQDPKTFNVKPEIGWIVHKGVITTPKDDLYLYRFLTRVPFPKDLPPKKYEEDEESA
ncbi:hypothetical protein TRFO_36896 [Tritrichomonas foetus]|uniref:Uncharacterized protein n=1 Tax=Tritrichomonas foetus TaxID=1144522 RepID=A0A1J4JH89_9EUKA|nr:hypothetical protein TRFO_36896 [Tritrichomonas foetus]|eukprot:OHS96971.1 hypothetical protein TRFO_36896 [Tritrichomonas foetus]